MMGFLSSLFGGLARSSVKMHRRSSKIDKVNLWKAAKKANGSWVPHGEWVKKKRK